MSHAHNKFKYKTSSGDFSKAVGGRCSRKDGRIRVSLKLCSHTSKLGVQLPNIEVFLQGGTSQVDVRQKHTTTSADAAICSMAWLSSAVAPDSIKTQRVTPCIVASCKKSAGV